MDEDVGDVSLAEGWSLTLSERGHIVAKSPLARLGVAVQLKFYQNFGRFPIGADDIADRALAYLCDQIERPISDLDTYGWTDRLGRRHRAEIMRFLGFAPLGADGLAELGIWL